MQVTFQSPTHAAFPAPFSRSPMSSFEGKTIVIAGVGRPGQAGEVVASRFIANGAHAVLVERDPTQADARARELTANGGRATGLGCDLADRAQLDRLAADLVRVAPDGIDAVVHLAGGFGASGKVAESDPDMFERQLAINLRTAYLTTRAVLPLLRQRKGAIVYFTSVAALPGGNPAEISAYAMAKAGVIALMRAVASEERANGVRANAVAPTAIRTSANEASMGPGARYVEREEIADVVLYLCSGAATAVSGEVIRLA
jgi:NAD(P)-dependent dehydrogenase (short-subunit alcohol dehydrogenase family)